MYCITIWWFHIYVCSIFATCVAAKRFVSFGTFASLGLEVKLPSLSWLCFRKLFLSIILHFSPTSSRVNERKHAMLHASAAPTPCCLKNCDQDTAGQKPGIYPKRVWFEKGQSPAGGKREVQQEGPEVQKKGSRLQKKNVVRSIKNATSKRHGTMSRKRGVRSVRISSTCMTVISQFEFEDIFCKQKTMTMINPLVKGH